MPDAEPTAARRLLRGRHRGRRGVRQIQAGQGSQDVRREQTQGAIQAHPELHQDHPGTYVSDASDDVRPALPHPQHPGHRRIQGETPEGLPGQDAGVRKWVAEAVHLEVEAVRYSLAEAQSAASPRDAAQAPAVPEEQPQPQAQAQQPRALAQAAAEQQPLQARGAASEEAEHWRPSRQPEQSAQSSQ